VDSPPHRFEHTCQNSQLSASNEFFPLCGTSCVKGKIFFMSQLMECLSIMSRPKKSLHFLVNNPNTNLHIFFNPKYHLHFFYICGGDKTETSNAEEQIVRD